MSHYKKSLLVHVGDPATNRVPDGHEETISGASELRCDGWPLRLDLPALELDHGDDSDQGNIENGNCSIHWFVLTLENLETLEPAHGHFFAEFLRGDINKALDGQIGVLDERLFREDHLAEIGVKLAGQDLFLDCFRFAGHLSLEDGLSGLAIGLADVFPLHEPGVGGGGVHGDIAGQCLEFVVIGDKIRLAQKLHDGANLTIGVYIGLNRAGFEDPIGFLGGQLAAFFAENNQGLLNISTCFLQGLLALHDRDAGLITQFLDALGRNFGGHGRFWIN